MLHPAVLRGGDEEDVGETLDVVQEGDEAGEGGGGVALQAGQYDGVHQVERQQGRHRPGGTGQGHQDLVPGTDNLLNVMIHFKTDVTASLVLGVASIKPLSY